ncbi:hypothetical protein CEXT_575851 [Caerostris extrusa]|uniref:Uncharacterized protein n=1 Tax=Caerostris extrusa TaxID=172846 RepID=A0AAV4XDW7_CAEEX|nr:hypothetical protein CEXT_575851 [Caerostris extrusa]
MSLKHTDESGILCLGIITELLKLWKYSYLKELWSWRCGSVNPVTPTIHTFVLCGESFYGSGVDFFCTGVISKRPINPRVNIVACPLENCHRFRSFSSPAVNNPCQSVLRRSKCQQLKN